MKKRVVVTGTGIISPIGEDWATVYAALKAKQNAVRVMDEWVANPKIRSKLAAPAIFTDPGFPRKTTRGMGRVALLAVTAAHRAVSQAGLLGNPVLSGGDSGVACGVSSGSYKAIKELISLTQPDAPNLLDATTYVRYMPQSAAVNISLFFSLKGRLVTTDVACAAGSLAIGSAYELIAAGKQTVMLAAGSDELSPFNTAIFDTLFATSLKNDTPKATPAPFDKNRDGLVIGEGAGCLVLEEYEHAKARGVEILAELVGFSQNCDGRHITQPNRIMMEAVMRSAVEDAGIRPEQIGYVDAHGTATDVGDVEETNAVYSLFKRPVPISSQKSYTGHTLGACGVLESFFAINMMKEKWFAPNLNLTEVDDRLPDLQYITGDGLHLDTEYVMSNNFAFGGVNTSLIFKRYDP